MSEFTARHFELLEWWKGQKCDRSDPEQAEAYDELREACAVTELEKPGKAGLGGES